MSQQSLCFCMVYISYLSMVSSVCSSCKAVHHELCSSNNIYKPKMRGRITFRQTNLTSNHLNSQRGQPRSKSAWEVITHTSIITKPSSFSTSPHHIMYCPALKVSLTSHHCHAKETQMYMYMSTQFKKG